MGLLDPKPDIATRGLWRGADIVTVRRVVGAVWLLALPVVLLFAFVLAPVDGDGWTLAAYVLWLGAVVVGVAVAFGPRRAGFAGLLSLTCAELVALAVLQLTAGGWAEPFWQLVAIHAVVIAACFPFRVAAAYIVASLLVTALPLLTGETAGRAVDVALHACVWLGLCAVGLAAMRRIRDRRVELARRATVDELTGLHNRRALAEVFPSGPTPGEVGLLGLGDVDEFKRVNDRHGHLVGDQCLREVAARLQEVVDGRADAFRWAGDEFAVLLVATDAEALDRHRAQVEAAMEHASTTPDDGHIGLTLGWSAWTAADGLDQALRRADAQLLERKRARRTDADASDRHVAIRSHERPLVVEPVADGQIRR